jgi:hypothetical protein
MDEPRLNFTHLARRNNLAREMQPSRHRIAMEPAPSLNVRDNSQQHMAGPAAAKLLGVRPS